MHDAHRIRPAVASELDGETNLIAIAQGRALEVPLVHEHIHSVIGEIDETSEAWFARASRARASTTFVHAAPVQPEKWPRLESMRDTQIQFDAFETPICFIGHSHRQAIVADTIGVFRVREGHRYLVNVGSVGQPRDRDARLGFALFDTEAFTVELIREHYDLAKTVAEIAAVGLPRALGDRLRTGT